MRRGNQRDTMPLREMALTYRCSLCFADTFENDDQYFDRGIDTLLTNQMDLAAMWKKGLSFCVQGNLHFSFSFENG